MPHNSLSSPRLPHDLFHIYILPDILSDHLHKLLVSSAVPDWHAFYTLPRVSPAFRETCKTLFAGIFGLENYESDSGNIIRNALSFTRSLWIQGSLPASQPISGCTYQDLMSGRGLIQVYVCVALARNFLNLDVLRPIAVEGRAKFLHEYYDAERGMPDSFGNSVESGPCDDVFHRVYMPLTCAITLCDSILPERLAYTAADYLAGIVPVYSTAPVLLKYAQDLKAFVIREHLADMDTWANWALQTLRLIVAIKPLLREIQGISRLVQSFSSVSFLPPEVIEATNIKKIIEDVRRSDWGCLTSEVKDGADSVLRELSASQ